MTWINVIRVVISMIYDQVSEFISQFPVQQLERNDILYHQDDTPQFIYFIKKGLVGLFHITENGKETFLRVFSDKAMLGHRSYFAEQNYHATAICLSKTEIIKVPKEKCEEVCATNPSFLKMVLKRVATDLAEAELRLSHIQDKTAKQRIAEALLFLKLKYPDITWTRKEIAEYSSSTHESVARLMTELEELKIIKKIGRDFEILDKDKLLHF